MGQDISPSVWTEYSVVRRIFVVGVGFSMQLPSIKSRWLSLHDKHFCWVSSLEISEHVAHVSKQ